MPTVQRFPTPKAVTQHIAATLAAAEYASVDQADLTAAGARLFWNGGDLDQAIGPITDPDFTGPAQDVLLLFAEAQQCIGRPDLIAARHLRMADQMDRERAFRIRAIAEDSARIAKLQADDAAPRDWLTKNWPDNSATVAMLEMAVARVRDTLPVLEAEAAQLRARAAELVAVKRAA